MVKKNENDVTFKGYMIERFNLQKEENISKEQQGTFSLGYNCARKNDDLNQYRVTVVINDLYTDKSKINLELCGFFEFSEECKNENKDYFLNVSAPAILYPYIRALISNITSFDIDETVVLPVLNFADSKFNSKN